MAHGVSAYEQKLIDRILDAICAAPHSLRARLLQRTFESAVSHGYAAWALVSRGFAMLLDESYEVLNRTLWSDMETSSYGVSEPGRRRTCVQLRALLFAHAHRHQASRAMDREERGVDGGLKLEEIARRLTGEARVDWRLVQTAEIDWHLAKASEHYRWLTACADADERIMAVGWHGFGDLGFLRLRYEKAFGHNREVPFRYSGRLYAPARCHAESARISARAGFPYAPPLSELARYSWIALQESYDALNPQQRIRRLEGCIRMLDRAIAASRQEYAPPLLLKAVALHQLRGEKRKPTRTGETEKLISKAVWLSPYDDIVQAELKAFSDALQKGAEAGAVGWGFYRVVKYAKPAAATKASLNGYLANRGGGIGPRQRDQFLILRRWSSYTPLISRREHRTAGGGYLLEWQGTRIAVDPGIGFVHNLHEAGHRVVDLDAVVVTHQHIDHADDLEAILSILKSQRSTLPKRKRRPHFLLTESGTKRWQGMIVSALKLQSANECITELHPTAGSGGAVSLGPITVTPVPLNGHQDAIDEAPDFDASGRPVPAEGRPPTGCGLVCELGRGTSTACAIGITSDTGYLAAGQSRGRGPARVSESYQGCDIVVLHLSTVDDLDAPSALRRQKDRFIAHSRAWAEKIGYSGMLYRKHLGFWGTVFLISDLIEEGGRSDRTIILSEFGEETLKSRAAILNEVCRVVASLGPKGVEQAKRIWIGDIGTQVRLPHGQISCHFGSNHCPNYADRFLEFDACDGDLTMPHRGWNDRSLFHFCQSHDDLVANPRAANRAIWGYAGLPVIDRELAEARERTTGEVWASYASYWLR